MTLKVFAQDEKITQKIIEEHKNYRIKSQPNNVRTAG